MTYLPPAEGFLGIEPALAHAPDEAAAVIIPYGLEATVTYGRGTRLGPQGILDASHEVELYDIRFRDEPALRWGVATMAPPVIPPAVDDALDRLAALVDDVFVTGRLPFVLGGEHTVTPGAIRPAVRRYNDLVLLHLDAHADLRDGYGGHHYSHAAAIRRCLDYPGVRVLSFGIRNISREEVAFAEQNPDRVSIAWAHERARWDLDALLAGLEGRPVWITVDVDALDASLMPSTGTPEPGGLMWDDVMRILDAASQRWGRVVGMDLTELAPIEGLPGPDFTAARLAYRMLSYALCDPPTR